MRRTLLALLFTLALATDALAAQGVNLRWDGCVASGGTLNKNFACNTNTGNDRLYLSFVLDAPLTSVFGFEGSIDVNPAGSALPAWWQYRNAGACRQNALTFTFSAGTEPTGCVNLLDWNGSLVGNLVTYTSLIVSGSPGYTRLQFVTGAPEADAITLPGGQEIHAGRFTINHTKTISTGSCQGCDAPVCLGVHKLKLTRPAALGDVLLYAETFPGSSTVSWQGANAGSVLDPETQGNDPGPDRTVTCAAAVPTRNRTWGTLKSLYR